MEVEDDPPGPPDYRQVHPQAGPSQVLPVTGDITKARDARTNADRLRTLFDLSPDPISLSRFSDGARLMVNQAWADATGIPIAQALDKPEEGLGTWVRSGDRRAIFAELEGKGTLPPREILARRADGSSFPALITARRMKDGDTDEVLIIGKDISGQRSLAAALLQREAQYLALFELAPFGVSVSRARDGRILEVNAAWEATTVFTRAEAVGSDGRELGLYAQPSDRKAMLAGLPRSGPIAPRVLNLLKRGGSPLLAEVSGAVLELRGERCLLAVLRDITEERRRQRELAESEERFRTVAEESPLAFFMHREGRFVYANPAAVRLILGPTSANLAGRRIQDFIHPCDVEEARKAVRETLATGRPVQIPRGRLLRGDGTTVEVAVDLRAVTCEGRRAILGTARERAAPSPPGPEAGPTLTGPTVELRPLREEDGPALLEAAADGRLWDLPFTVVPGPDTLDAYLRTALAGQRAGTVLPFVIVRRDTGRIVGSTRFWKIDRPNLSLEIGHTWLAASAQRTGVNTEAKRLLLTYAFETFHAVRVQLTTDVLNPASRAAILRLGAVQEGVIRHERIMPDGRRRDSVRFSILDSEWPDVRARLLALAR